MQNFEFSKQLLDWYQKEKRDLPWRGEPSPYRIWLSEVMCQQTQVATAIPFYERWLAELPSISAVAEADIGRILKLWEGLGYYARARNFHAACKLICTVPNQPEDFAKLPGVGEYICAAVQSIAFGHTLPVLDANVKRVVSRLLLLDLGHASGLAKAKQFLQKRISADAPGDFNQAMMELGARICTPKNFCCDQCPLQGNCAAFTQSRQAEYPLKKVKKERPVRRQLAGVFVLDNRVLLQQRKPQGLLGGLWEFPWLTLESKENPVHGLTRLLRQYSLLCEAHSAMQTVIHDYSHFRLELHAFRCQISETASRNEGWVTAEDMPALAFHGAIQKLIKQGIWN